MEAIQEEAHKVTIRKVSDGFVIKVGDASCKADELEEFVQKDSLVSEAARTLGIDTTTLTTAILDYLEAREAERKTKRVPFWSSNGSVYEAVQVEEGKVVFLTYDGESYKTKTEIGTDSGLVIKPDLYSEQSSYTFTKDEITSAKPQTVKQLYERVYRIVDDYFAHPDPRIAKFMSLYIIHNYCLSKSNGVIFIWLVGRKRSGKSTLQLICERLGYRPFAGVSPTPSTIYRSLGETEYGPMIIVKEFEWANDTMKEITRDGNISGNILPRTDEINHRKVVVHYCLYGARVVGSNVIHGDEADRDRYFIIKCMRLKPKRPRAELLRNKKVIADLKQIQKDLLLWKIANLEILQFPYEDTEGEILDRDWENFGGVIVLAGMISDELASEMRRLVISYIEEKKTEESSGLYSLLLEAIQNLANANNKLGDDYIIKFKDIWAYVEKNTAEGTHKNGKPVRVTSNGEQITTTKAGRLLKEQLFGKADSWNEGDDSNRKTVRGYVWPATLVELLGVTGVTSVTGVEGAGRTKQASSVDSETNDETPERAAEKGSPSVRKPVTPVTPVTGLEAHPNG